MTAHPLIATIVIQRTLLALILLLMVFLMNGIELAILIEIVLLTLDSYSLKAVHGSHWSLLLQILLLLLLLLLILLV